jgi:hypothetical protein
MLILIEHDHARPDIVQALLRAAPDCVYAADVEGLRPVNPLPMAIVNFEQRAAKAKKVQVKKHTMIKNKLYKCVRLIVAAHANLTADEQQPLLHTCLQASNTLPIRLVALVIRRFKDQLALAKAQGNLPLHIAAASWPLDQDFLPHILREYPVGAQVPNKEGKLPLDVAETAGRGWNTGMRWRGFDCLWAFAMQSRRDSG